MSLLKSTPFLLSAAGAVAVLLSGCVVAPAPRPVYRAAPPVVYQQPYPQPAPALVVVYQAPPAPQAEYIGIAPGPEFFWLSGVWLWEGGRHVWHPGHWEAHRPGQVYSPHVWVRAGQGWELRGGHWGR